jgi:signal transduction histidine kinase
VVGEVSRVSAYAASCFVAYGVNLLLGAVVLMHRRTERLNQAFFVGCAVLSAWSLAAFVLASTVGEAEAARWARFLAYAACLFAPVSIRIVSLLTGRPGRVWVAASQSVAILLATLTAAELVVIGVERAPATWVDVAWRAVPGPLGWLLGAHLLTMAAVSVTVLIRHAHDARGLDRARTRYLALAAVILSISMLHDTAVAAIDSSHLFDSALLRPWVPPASALWALVTAYALIRDRLADLGAALRRSVVRTTTLALLTVPFVYLLVEAENAFEGVPYLRFSLVSLLAFAAAAYLVPPLTTVAHEGLDRLLGARSTRHRRALVDFSKEAAQFNDPKELVARARFELCSPFGLEAADVLLHDGRGGFVPVDGWRLPGTAPDAAGVADLLAYFRQARGPAVLEEMERKPSSHRTTRAIRALATGGAAAAFELRSPESVEGVLFLGSRGDGEPFTIEDVETLTILANQLAATLRNVKLLEDLAHSREIIARSERLSAIGTLAAGLAHEIRNPLVSIRTFTQLLPERLDDEEFRSRFLDLTLAEVDRICALVNELLSFARPTPAMLEPVDLAGCVERLCLLLASQARNRGVTLELAGAMDRDAVVLADEDQLKQVVMNVVLNAVQACVEGGRVRVSCYATETVDGRMGCVEVVDDGCGIAAQDLGRVFDPFYTTRSEGTGLGLAVAHRIVSSHGGTIDVSSRPGRGSTFVIRLPADVATARSVLDPQDFPQPVRAHG